MSMKVTIIECNTLPTTDVLGNRCERTAEKIETIGKKFFQRSAIRFAQRNRPLTPFYHLRVEKVNGRWEVNVYQNKLVPNEPDHPRG